MADGKEYAFEISNIPSKANSMLLAAGSAAEADDWIGLLLIAAQNTQHNIGGDSYVSLTVTFFPFIESGLKLFGTEV